MSKLNNPFYNARNELTDLSVAEIGNLVAEAFGGKADFLGHEVLRYALTEIAEVDRIEISGYHNGDGPFLFSECPGIERRGKEADEIFHRVLGPKKD